LWKCFIVSNAIDMEATFTIIGTVPSKPNTYQIIVVDGKRRLGKSKTLKDYEGSFYLQCPIRNKNIQGFFKVQIDVFFPSLSHDIDNAAKIILDCLQSSKVIKNDNRCVELLMRKFKDAVNPRCVITIEEVEL